MILKIAPPILFLVQIVAGRQWMPFSWVIALCFISSALPAKALYLRVAEVQREGQELMAKGKNTPSREGDGDVIPTLCLVLRHMDASV